MVVSKGVAARQEKIGTEGPPLADDLDPASRASMTKALSDVGQIARVIAELDWLREALELGAAIENDQSLQPARLQAIISELCDFLSRLPTQELDEVPADPELNASPLGTPL